jgi:hypothetical protein
MKLAGEYDYRNAKAILQATAPQQLVEIYDVLQHADSAIKLEAAGDSARKLSAQMKKWFVAKGWKEEQPAFSVPGMHYDLLKDRVPIEIEIGHERLVFPDFFEFLADYSKWAHSRCSHGGHGQSARLRSLLALFASEHSAKDRIN